MSGHSKWSQIKHKKALTDAKKGKIFSQLAQQITIASRQKGGDPETNSSLRMIVDKARSLNMPLDNIERAIKRGTGEIAGADIEEFLLEAYGPGGSALIIEGATDNKNRTVSEIKFLLNEGGGKLADPGSVLWLFEKGGLLSVKKQPGQSAEGLELAAIDSGAQDLKWLDEENLEIYTRPGDLTIIEKNLREKNIPITDSSLEWRPKSEIAIDDQQTKDRLEKLLEELDNNNNVNEIYSNVKY